MIVVMKSDSDFIKMRENVMRMVLESRGVPITLEVHLMVQIRARLEHQEMKRERSAQGVPDKFVRLFETVRKRELEAFCAAEIIEQSELSLLISNCAQIGWVHEAIFIEYYPEHLQLTAEDIQSLGSDDRAGQKARTKSIQMFEERKHVHAHIFSNEDRWFCLFFDFRDIESRKENHWKLGSHIHVVSYLHGVSLTAVKAEFQKRKISLPKEHVRFQLRPEN